MAQAELNAYQITGIFVFIIIIYARCYSEHERPWKQQKVKDNS